MKLPKYVGGNGEDLGLKHSPDRFWFSRHYIALSTLASVYIGLAAPGSLNAQVLEKNGVYGWALAVGLAAVSLLLLAEAFTTAFARGVQLEFLRRRRHTILMTLAIMHICMGVLIVEFAPSAAGLVVRFGLDATAAMGVAFLDLFQRHKAGRCYP